jgi:glyoxylase-like metal-dependent hydrolase (beta-lactamase superfamily II)
MTQNIKSNPDIFTVAPGVWGMKDVFVNIYMVQEASTNSWVLIDAGLKWSVAKIKNMATLLFGENSRPSSIVLTHGHFDHVGSVKKLADLWNVPVYAHYLEMPYLTGQSSYPPPDPTVEGGMMATMAFVYPKGPIDLKARIHTLPENGQVPGLPEWRYYHTPGHAPGHISLYRESDGVLIAGDAVVTTKQESALSVMMQTKKLCGPPRYFTPDWQSAAWSVEQLAALEPDVLATGHGRPMSGEKMRNSLHNLAKNFQRTAVPIQGRYTYEPALTDEKGVVYVPPKAPYSAASVIKVLGVAATVLITLMLFSNQQKQIKKYRASYK